MRAMTAIALPDRSALTPLQRWRLRRNAVIAAARRGGASQTLIADAFDLSQPMVHHVLKSLRNRNGTQHAKLQGPQDSSAT
jgi:predicted transcriptional regulator